MRSDFLGEQSADVITAARAAYRGILVGNMGYTPEEAAAAIAEKKVDAVAFGVPFLANPDLPARVRSGEKLNVADPTTFYTPGPKGYTDYPSMNAG
jgi:N-ethylmaleimide reductase